MTSRESTTTEPLARLGFSLMELMAALAIIALLAMLVVPRTSIHRAAGDASACHAHQGEIELQCQLWHRIQGEYPKDDLGNIGVDINYFPQGLPTCPVDGTSYTIDHSTGRVVGHTH